MTANDYIPGIGRNPGEEHLHTHLYRNTEDGLRPMCMYGWNRSDGRSISIFRGQGGSKGLCRICKRRAAGNLPPVPPTYHKTKGL